MIRKQAQQTKNENKKLGRYIKMLTMITSVLQNKKGQGMVEYGLILALVAVVGMAGLVLLGPQVVAQFNTVAGAL
jgi:pilus assembly protein Flp/PilA